MSLLAAAFVMISLAVPPTADRPRSFFAVEVEEVDPAGIERYEKGVALLVGEIRRAGLPAPWWVSTSQRDNRYSYVFEVASLDELNPHSPVAAERLRSILEAIGEPARERVVAATVPSPVRSLSTTVVEPVAGLSYRPDRPRPAAPAFLLCETHRVRQDTIDPYTALRERLVAAARAAGYGAYWTTYRSVLGEGRCFFGGGRYYYHVTPFEERSELAGRLSLERALERSLGETAARRLVADLAECLEGCERAEHRIRPDLCPTPGGVP